MKYIGNSKGHVLVYSLFLISLIGTLITAWLTMTSTQTTTDYKRLNSQAANSLAKSGLESFIAYLYKYPGGSKVDYLKSYSGWGPQGFANEYIFTLILKDSDGNRIQPNEIQAGSPPNGLKYYAVPEVTLNNVTLNDYISYKFTVDTNTGSVTNGGPVNPSTQPAITSNPIVYPVETYSATGFDTGEKNVLAASEMQLDPTRDAYFDTNNDKSFSLEEKKAYFNYQFTNNLVPTQFDYGGDGSIKNLDQLKHAMVQAMATPNSTGQYIFKCDCAGSYPTADIDFPPSIMGNKKFIVYVPGNLILGDNQGNQTVNWTMQGMLLVAGDFTSEQQSNVLSINNIIVNGTLNLKGGNNENQSNYSTFLSVLSDATNNNYYVKNTTSITYSPYTTVNSSNTGFDPTRSP